MKSLIFFSVTFNFSSLQTADAITSESLFQRDDPRVPQLLAVLYDCCMQNNLRQNSLTWVRKCTQAPSEIELLLLFFFVQNRKEFHCFGNIQKTRFT